MEKQCKDVNNNDAESNSDEDNHTPTKKKTVKRKQLFRNEYITLFSGVIAKSTRGCEFAFCTKCKVDFAISHGGSTDISRHIATQKHKGYAALEKNNEKISSFFTTTNDYSVTNAEVLFTEFLVEHSLPISAADHAGKLFKKMFPDSKIAQQYSSGRTKTSCIIDTLSKNDKTLIIENLRKGPFSLGTDGSTDYEDVKLYPICVRYFDEKSGHVLSVLLSLTECSQASTGENIFKLIENELDQSSIPWENFISFSTDNASVMVGKHKGVAAFLCKRVPALHINGK
jgi:hypothetical protein